MDISKYIPNALVSAPGEITLREKLQPFIDTSTAWFEEWFCPLSLISPPADHEDIYDTAMKIIVAEAYRNAVPQLDLVLTANGFATVDSKNVVPASKARTDRLLEGLNEQVNRNIVLLVRRLSILSSWIETPQASYFRSTLFCFPDELDDIGCKEGEIKKKPTWDHYREMLPLVADLEDSLANEWFSPELVSALRREIQSGDISDERRGVAIKIKNQLARYFVTKDFSTRRLADILNVIRRDAKNFPEWVASETAENFYPPIFRNEKKSSGYFF